MLVDQGREAAGVLFHILDDSREHQRLWPIAGGERGESGTTGEHDVDVSVHVSLQGGVCT